MTKNIILLVVSIAISLFSAEVFLRGQGGTFIQLNGFYSNIRDYSYEFHHTRSPADSEAQLIVVNPDRCPANGASQAVMFFGDSWVAEGGVPEGFARYVAQHDEFRCYQIINGGVGSFSPSLIMLKAPKMIEREQPVLVLINIDATDLMDEWIRYRHGSVRDASGALIAVVPSPPDIPDFVFYYGLSALEEQPVYLLRLAEKLYFTRLFMPRIAQVHERQYMLPTFENLFAPQTSRDPRADFAAPIAYFGDRLLEMIARLKRVMGRTPMALTYHPHYLHINGTDDERYNDIVREILLEETTRADTPFYDATPDFGTIHGPDAADVFRWPEDRYSHLTHRSYVAYGYWIAQQTAPLLRTRPDSPAPSKPEELKAYDGVSCDTESRAVLICRSVPDASRPPP